MNHTIYIYREEDHKEIDQDRSERTQHNDIDNETRFNGIQSNCSDIYYDNMLK